MENPFRYGDVAAGAFFTNRTSELAELTADVKAGQNVVIISPRRYGKTSLVMRAIDQLQADGVLVAYIDLFRAPTKDLFADQLAAALYSGLVSLPGQAMRKALDIFKGLPIRPKVTLGDDGTPSIELATGERARDVDRIIDSLLELPGKIVLERKKRVALVIDEFQEVVELDRRLPARMRAIFQMQPEVSHVFLGSKRTLMQRVFTSVNEPMYKLAKPLPLNPIRNEDFAAFIGERCRSTGKAVTPEAITRLLDITQCHPHDTQELCYFTWAAAKNADVDITPDLVDSALARVLAAEDARYTTLWDLLPVSQRLILTALVKEPGDALYSEGFRRRHRLGAASSVQRSVATLLERDLIEGTAATGFSVPDVFLRAWVRARSG